METASRTVVADVPMSKINDFLLVVELAMIVAMVNVVMNIRKEPSDCRQYLVGNEVVGSAGIGG